MQFYVTYPRHCLSDSIQLPDALRKLGELLSVHSWRLLEPQTLRFKTLALIFQVPLPLSMTVGQLLSVGSSLSP